MQQKLQHIIVKYLKTTEKIQKAFRKEKKAYYIQGNSNVNDS